MAGFGRSLLGRVEDGLNAGDRGQRDQASPWSSDAWAPGRGSYQLPTGENGEERAQGRTGSKMVKSHSGYIQCEKPAGHLGREAQEVAGGTSGTQGRGQARDLHRPVSQEDRDVT